MAVLSRVSAPPGYGILTGAPAEKPRRFVSDGHGGGAWLTTTETEDEAANAALQAERAAREAANLALFSPTANAAASRAATGRADLVSTCVRLTASFQRRRRNCPDAASMPTPQQYI